MSIKHEYEATCKCARVYYDAFDYIWVYCSEKKVECHYFSTGLCVVSGKNLPEKLPKIEKGQK